MPSNKVSGIYEIRCLLNNKKYIGSSRNVKQRLLDHKCLLKNNKHGNAHLQSAWNKYGEGMFTFVQIEVCEEEVLLERETYWMEFFKSRDSKFGYNVVLPGGIPNSVLDLEKNPKTPREECNYKPIVRLSREGIERGLISKDIVERDGLNYKALSKRLRYWRSTYSKHKSYKGVMYVYEDEYNEEFDYLNYKKPIAPRVKKEKVRKVPKPISERNIIRTPIIAEHSETNEVLEFTSITEALQTLNGQKGKIHKCINNEFKRYKHRGYFFKRKETGGSSD